ncbi:hypothetical protein BU23DRAFT_197065 [Bimuria novae-zelandiae CBS 107.79]|uniref:F-box domain-containing protein n=1 Tax=Bimuria novae-zelandiae CBS 107.79 TaxID=1447943 RepID=A0A6A5V0J4_9PLEO|nr:hypothetical protein BU23DRAFT_197065 [Bimuria novae-zelandiae CBS 107.79]
MANLLGLPDELLLKIAHYLYQDAGSRQQALVNLALSSRELTGIATKLFYQAPAVTELQILNFQRSVLTLKDVSKNITKLDLNLEKPGLYKASEFRATAELHGACAPRQHPCVLYQSPAVQASGHVPGNVPEAQGAFYTNHECGVQ